MTRTRGMMRARIGRGLSGLGVDTVGNPSTNGPIVFGVLALGVVGALYLAFKRGARPRRRRA